MPSLIHPYVFPGIQGTMERPFPSEFPLPMEVLRVCCEVFQTYGRSCSVYDTEFIRSLPPITTDRFMFMELPRNILCADIAKAFIYIVIEHVRWRRTAKSIPDRYTQRFLANCIHMRRSNVAMSLKAANNMIRHDSCFREVYFRIIERLMNVHRLDISRDRIDELQQRAA